MFSKGPSSNTRFIAAIIISILLLIIAHQTNYLNRVKDSLSFIVHPILVVIDLPSKAYSFFTESNADRAALMEENIQLKNESLMLKARLQKFDAIEKENTRLHNLLESSFKLGEQFIAASLLKVNLNPTTQHIVIDKGHRFNLFAGQAAINADGVIGQIVQVNPLTSSIMLITDPNHAIPVEINRTGLKTIVVGQGAKDTLSVLYLPHNTDLLEGDILSSSGLGGVFPKGYPVATISKLSPLPGEAFMHVEAQPIANINNTHEVLLVWHRQEALSLLPETSEKLDPVEANAR
ncbi:MAG: rod shape-determining protein MreC [Cycloclasticus sp.]|nr:MAG: rod shape-determining protein MreC [Cycloclasticus sp.]